MGTTTAVIEHRGGPQRTAPAILDGADEVGA
jgi:hypothetical protein